MRVIIVGGGIGGLTLALMLHARGIGATVYEQASEIREVGVGINTLPHAIRELADLGLLPAGTQDARARLAREAHADEDLVLRVVGKDGRVAEHGALGARSAPPGLRDVREAPRVTRDEAEELCFGVAGSTAGAELDTSGEPSLDLFAPRSQRLLVR